MAISKVKIENFKGIGSATEIHIRPITIFIGQNSSGKSSCIHALACLSQTLKVPNNAMPIVLDDEHANVHLGRFIEVLHSKKYSDKLVLGISTDEISIRFGDKGEEIKSTIDVSYEFKCVQRTQEIRIENASIKFADYSYAIKWSKNRYILTNLVTSKTIPCELGDGFMVKPESIFSGSSEDISEFIFLLNLQTIISHHLTNTFYLGPFRESPRRRYETRGANPSEVGSRGEAAITMMANESLQKRSKPHINQISNWLVDLGLATNVSISRVGRSDLVDVHLGLSDGGVFPIADLGYGLSQVLPVLAQCSFSKERSTLLFEQPEIHLHTKSSKQLASVFIETALKKNSRVILETHSPELVKQFLLELDNGNIKPEDLMIYKVERVGAQTCINEVQIDVGPDGEIDVYENWENGISM